MSASSQGILSTVGSFVSIILHSFSQSTRLFSLRCSLCLDSSRVSLSSSSSSVGIVGQNNSVRAGFSRRSFSTSILCWAITAILNVANHGCHSTGGFAPVSQNKLTPIGDLLDCAMWWRSFWFSVWSVVGLVLMRLLSIVGWSVWTIAGRSTISLGLRSGVRVGLTLYDSSILADKRTTFKVELRPRFTNCFSACLFYVCKFATLVRRTS